MSTDDKAWDRPIHTGIGQPGYKKDLSAEDEKRVDDKGNLVVHKEPWSYVPTGLYLTIYGTHSKDMTVNRKFYGSRIIVNGKGFCIGVMTTDGKPTFNVDAWGASLELPADLAKDELKKAYVSEWIIETVKEILGGAEQGIANEHLDDLPVWLVVQSDAAIRKTGL